MIGSKTILGIIGLGTVGGVGTTGVVYGPTAIEMIGIDDSELPEVEKGKSVTFKVSASGSSASLDCAGQAGSFVTLDIEKPKPDSQDYKEKLVCKRHNYERSPQKNEIKGSDGNSNFSCKRTFSKGIEQSFECSYPGKPLTISVKEESNDKFLAIQWS
ncbi:hypothetical protein MHLP_01355 [Candidatus Mycoplasma haematolamae str. Purdue]|uniref:Uncharacterized protein n=1 Tax=Mycoplasma haematolamae (strain Purdue) TaxID=1212765 RepID=I7CF12_MYCHA|nr:hypothetical protein [Candidatus Mycoplasma haematolamae]AFO51851.1 hypothetical protein MHLP_01355 [Candidatus Mycoplasma haematolamae str. Purdue]